MSPKAGRSNVLVHWVFRHQVLAIANPEGLGKGAIRI
jgi:hypothetical protein